MLNDIFYEHYHHGNVQLLLLAKQIYGREYNEGTSNQHIIFSSLDFFQYRPKGWFTLSLREYKQSEAKVHTAGENRTQSCMTEISWLLARQQHTYEVTISVANLAIFSPDLAFFHSV